MKELLISKRLYTMLIIKNFIVKENKLNSFLKGRFKQKIFLWINISVLLNHKCMKEH